MGVGAVLPLPLPWEREAEAEAEAEAEEVAVRALTATADLRPASHPGRIRSPPPLLMTTAGQTHRTGVAGPSPAWSGPCRGQARWPGAEAGPGKCCLVPGVGVSL